MSRPSQRSSQVSLKLIRPCKNGFWGWLSLL